MLAHMAEGQCLWGKQPIKYCIDPSETLHKKTTCTVLTQSAQTCFRRKTGCSFKWLVACFLAGYNILNNLGSFCSMLARLFIYDFRDNNRKWPTLTGTSSQATFWKNTLSQFLWIIAFKKHGLGKWRIKSSNKAWLTPWKGTSNGVTIWIVLRVAK